MKFEELKMGHKCIEVKSRVELQKIRSYCLLNGIKCNFKVNDLDVKKGCNLFVIRENDKAFLFWNEASGDRKKFDILDIDEFDPKELPQIDLSNKYILIDENRDLLFDMLEEQGYIWCNGGEKPREWDSWKTVNVIGTQENGKIIYNATNRISDVENFSDILMQYRDQILATQPKQFTKSDLKDGMIVEYKSKSRRLVLGLKLTGKKGFSRLSNYDEDLRNRLSEDCDICKIYRSKNICCIEDIFEDENLELIWEREENTPPKWTDWKDIENNEMFEFRQKGLKIEVRRPAIKEITVSATCLPTDTFDLRYGQQLCIKKWNVEFAKKSLDDYSKGTNE